MYDHQEDKFKYKSDERKVIRSNNSNHHKYVGYYINYCKNDSNIVASFQGTMIILF